MKRIFSVVLTLAILLSMFGGIAETVSAAEMPAEMLPAYEEEAYPTQGTCGERLKWEFHSNTGTLQITGSGPMYDYGVEIWYESVDPDVEESVRSPKGAADPIPMAETTKEMAPWYEFRYLIEHVEIQYGVTTIGDGAFYYHFYLNSVKIPETVTSIGNDAFYGCELEELIFPEGLRKIGSYAFEACGELTDVYIPASVEYIGNGAFASCYALQKIRMSPNNNHYSVDDKGVLYSKDKTLLIQCPGGFRGDYEVAPETRKIGSYGFSRCELESLSLPEGLQVIAFGAFYFAEIYDTLVLPTSVESLEDRAFYNFDAPGIVIMNPDCEIGWESLYYAGIVFGYPGSEAEVERDNDWPFVGHIPVDGTCAICGASMAMSGQCGDDATWELVQETNGWTLYIRGTGALWSTCDFEVYNGLTERVIISEGITEAGNFHRSTILNYVELPQSLTTLMPCAFEECRALRSIVIPDGVESIPDSCFYKCINLQKVTYPTGLRSIGDNAFYECDGLKQDVQFPETLESIGEYAYSGCDFLWTVTLGANVRSIGEGAFAGCYRVRFKVSEENTVFSSDENKALCNADGTVLLCWPGNLGGEVTIPAYIKEIAPSAFAYHQRLTTVWIPSTVEKVGEGAFRSSTIRKLIYEPNDWLVPEECFHDCRLLEEIHLGDEITTIGEWAFAFCESLKEYTLGENITYVGLCGFEFVNALERVTILNPNCYFEPFSLGAELGSVIRGYPDSTAEEYAEKYGLSFEALPEENRPEPPFTIEDFTDCDAEWYQEGIDFMLRRGYMNGVGKDTFAPDNTLNRAMVVTVLYRVDGTPEAEGSSAFADVAEGLWYSDAVAWAGETGIVNGINATTFAPTKAITREQIATILWRYAGEPEAEGDLNAFTDAGDSSDYAQKAMSWAVSVGILQGTGKGELNPTANATRAQFACMVHRYLTKV